MMSLNDQDEDNDFFFLLFVTDGEGYEPIIVENTCYICGKVWEDTELSEICSPECLAIEEFYPVAGEDVCGYDFMTPDHKPCILKAGHAIPCRSGAVAKCQAI